jgi:Fe-S-cluster-containing dehydrogenase component
MGKWVFTRRDFVKISLGSLTIFATGMSPLLSSIIEASEGKAQLVRSWNRPKYNKNYCMVIVSDRCIDCERCMEACRKGWNVPEYGYRTRVLEIRENGKLKTFLPVPCMQCDDPPCVAACPTSASIKRKEDGIIIVQQNKCMGCKVCMLSCPYDARYFNEEKRAIDKCDFCLPRLEKGLKPFCVEACPTHARIFGDLNDKESEVYKILSDVEREIKVLKEELSTHPKVFYTHS